MGMGEKLLTGAWMSVGVWLQLRQLPQQNISQGMGKKSQKLYPASSVHDFQATWLTGIFLLKAIVTDFINMRGELMNPVNFRNYVSFVSFFYFQK